jgi:hypothetical protein
VGAGAAAAAVLALALAWSLQPLVHDDLFWHLRAGEWIAAHHRVPLTDLFSYTRPGARWITHEWGFSLVSWLIYRAAGTAGLVLATTLLTLAIFAAVAWRALELAAAERRRGADTGAASSRLSRWLLLMALLALGLWAASPELFLRAALAGELLLALALAALARWQRTGRRRWLVGLAALFWVWANVHSSVLFGLGVLALYALEPPFTAALARRRATGRPLLLTLAAALALVLLNPNGAAAPLYPLLLARILYASGIPWELGHFASAAPAGGAAAAPLWLLVVLLLLALLPLRQARRLSLAEGASIAAFLLFTLVSHRFVFDLVVVALPVLYKLLALAPPPDATPAPLPGQPAPLDSPAPSAQPALPDSPPPAPRPAPPSRRSLPSWLGLAGRPALAAALVALFLLPIGPAAVAAAAAGWSRRPPAAGGLIAEHLPQAAVRFIAAQGIAGPGDRLFNHQNWGGFAGWRLRVPVFWDGRNDVFAELVREVATTPFEVTARRYGCDYLLIAEHDDPGIQADATAGRWGLVYWDDFAAVYLRRGPRYAPLLRRLDLRLFPPFGGRPGLAALAADPARAAAARAELQQVLSANPANQRALYFAGLISLYRGELRRGVQELQAASRIRPNDQVEALLDRLRRLPAYGIFARPDRSP